MASPTPAEIEEAVEWARRVVETSEALGQSCHEYEFAARALVAIVGEQEVDALAQRLFAVYRRAYHEAIVGAYNETVTGKMGDLGELKLADASEWERAAWMAVAAEAARRG